MTGLPATLGAISPSSLFLWHIQLQVHCYPHHTQTFKVVAPRQPGLPITRRLLPASSPPLQLAPPTPSQNARPGPAVIAARDSSWHKCWHSVGITCNNVCRLHPSRAIIITSQQEIGYSLAWFLGASFTFGAGLFRDMRKERREESLGAPQGSELRVARSGQQEAAGWAGDWESGPGRLCHRFALITSCVLGICIL